MTRRSVFTLGALWISGAVFLGAQESAGDRVVVPFRDASKPRQLRVRLVNGGVTVRGYAGKDVIVETHNEENRDSRPNRRSDGLHRINVTGGGLNIEEENNVVSVSSRSMGKEGAIIIQVPFETSLNLRAVNDGDIVVEKVSGELDVNNTNGRVILRNVSGAVTAHALNGELTASIDRVSPDKTMSFSTLNGDIDVTLPPDLKARMKIKADNGEVLSDFDIKLDPNTTRATVESKGESGGRYRVRVDRTTTGTVNGGGPEIQFTSFNGKIMIRKRK